MRRTDERRGIALVATLALLVFVGMMIAAALRGNLAQRKYLRLRQQEAMARCLAESGVNEAIRAIARRTGTMPLERDTGDGRFRVEWKEAPPGTSVYEIRSVGISGPDDPESPRRAVTVRAEIRQDKPARIVSWESSSAK